MVSLPLVDLWPIRKIVFSFTLINLKTRFKGTNLGLLWFALEPLLTFILLYVVFSTIRERNKEDFAIYLMTGIMLYHIFTRGTMGGLSSFRNNKQILQSLNIPREFFPAVITLGMGILTFVEIGVFLGLMPFFSFIPSFSILLLPFVILLILLLVLGVSYILSVLDVFFRDIQPIWAVFAHALFFITPIFWYVEDVSGILLSFHQFNPVGQIIDIAHHLVVFRTIPPLVSWIYPIISVLVIFFGGYAVFRKYSDRVVEEL